MTEPDVPDNDQVKFELAQEFLALGLLAGARELALEYMACVEPWRHSEPLALISQIDELQEKQRAHQAELLAMAMSSDEDSDLQH